MSFSKITQPILILVLMGGFFLYSHGVDAATCACYFSPDNNCAEVYVSDRASQSDCKETCKNAIGNKVLHEEFSETTGDENISFACEIAANKAQTKKLNETNNANTDALKSATALETYAPDVNVEIPGLIFSPVKLVKNLVTVGFIGDYISVVYNVLIPIATIIAIIMIMIGGLQWAFGAVSKEQIAAAKKRMMNAIAGLVLLLCTFLILKQVNPQLVSSNPLQFEVVQPVDSLIIEDKEPYTGSAKPINDTTYDDTFKAFANCIKIDYRILKVIAYKESGLNPTIKNSIGFTGLFQTKEPNCRDALKRYPAWAGKCNDLTNVQVNTAVGTMLARSSFRVIENACGAMLNAQDTMTLIYLGHNSGPGSVSYILNNGGCAGGDAIRKGIINFWNQHKGGKFKGKELGEKRYPFAKRVGDLVLAQGVSNFADVRQNGPATCPLNGAPNF